VFICDAAPIELARSRPGKILFSSGGAGSSTHLNGERFRLAAGIKAVHVGFKGSSDAMLEVVERLRNFDYLLMPSTPEEMDRILRADIQTFSEVITLAGLRAK